MSHEYRLSTQDNPTIAWNHMRRLHPVIEPKSNLTPLSQVYPYLDKQAGALQESMDHTPQPIQSETPIFQAAPRPFRMTPDTNPPIPYTRPSFMTRLKTKIHRSH